MGILAVSIRYLGRESSIFRGLISWMVWRPWRKLHKLVSFSHGRELARMCYAPVIWYSYESWPSWIGTLSLENNEIAFSKLSINNICFFNFKKNTIWLISILVEWLSWFPFFFHFFPLLSFYIILISALVEYHPLCSTGPRAACRQPGLDQCAAVFGHGA